MTPPAILAPLLERALGSGSTSEVGRVDAEGELGVMLSAIDCAGSVGCDDNISVIEGEFGGMGASVTVAGSTARRATSMIENVSLANTSA